MMMMMAITKMTMRDDYVDHEMDIVVATIRFLLI